MPVEEIFGVGRIYTRRRDENGVHVDVLRNSMQNKLIVARVRFEERDSILHLQPRIELLLVRGGRGYLLQYFGYVKHM